MTVKFTPKEKKQIIVLKRALNKHLGNIHIKIEWERIAYKKMLFGYIDLGGIKLTKEELYKLDKYLNGFDITAGYWSGKPDKITIEFEMLKGANGIKWSKIKV